MFFPFSYRTVGIINMKTIQFMVIACQMTAKKAQMLSMKGNHAFVG
jgi:hypothetical protein